MNLVKFFENACWPAKLNMILSLTGLLGVLSQLITGKISSIVGIIVILIKLFIIFVWSYFLNYLCKTGHSGIAWTIFLFPLIIVLLILFAAVIYVVDKKHSPQNKKK